MCSIYLEAIAGFGFLADNIQDWVDELCTFGVVALGPVVTGAGLTEDEVVFERYLKYFYLINNFKIK